MRSGSTRIVHVATVHRADDVRIFHRECRSLAAVEHYEVSLAAAGDIPSDSGIEFFKLPPRPANRPLRLVLGPIHSWQFARKHRFDVWHFHELESLPLAIWLARRGDTVIWDAHEDYIVELVDGGSKSWVPRPARRTLRRLLASLLRTADRSASGVVAATDAIAARYSNPLTVVVGNEARSSDFESCRPSFNRSQLLFTAACTTGNCFPQLVEACELLPDLELVVAGRDPRLEVWTEAQRRLGSRVHHVGWLDREELTKAISNSTLGLVTYAPTRATVDNAGNKLFEFAMAGLPIVATPTESNRRFLEQSQFGVLAHDFTSAALADAIRVALSDPGRWEQMSQAGRAWAAEHGSWEASEKRLLDLYATLTARG